MTWTERKKKKVGLFLVRRTFLTFYVHTGKSFLSHIVSLLSLGCQKIEKFVVDTKLEGATKIPLSIEGALCS